LMIMSVGPIQTVETVQLPGSRATGAVLTT